jgi:hypothetical protein
MQLWMAAGTFSWVVTRWLLKCLIRLLTAAWRLIHVHADDSVALALMYIDCSRLGRIACESQNEVSAAHRNYLRWHVRQPRRSRRRRTQLDQTAAGTTAPESTADMHDVQRIVDSLFSDSPVASQLASPAGSQPDAAAEEQRASRPSVDAGASTEAAPKPAAAAEAVFRAPAAVQLDSASDASTAESESDTDMDSDDTVAVAVSRPDEQLVLYGPLHPFAELLRAAAAAPTPGGHQADQERVADAVDQLRTAAARGAPDLFESVRLGPQDAPAWLTSLQGGRDGLLKRLLSARQVSSPASDARPAMSGCTTPAILHPTSSCCHTQGPSGSSRVSSAASKGARR